MPANDLGIDESIFMPEAACFLSMDIALRFFRPIGLEPADTLEFQRVLRALVQVNRLPQVGVSTQTEYEAFAVSVYEGMSRSFSPEFSDTFRLWFREIFCPSAGSDWDAYFLAVAAWAARFDRQHLDIVGFGPNTKSLLDAFRRARDLADVKAGVESAKQMPRSGWDEHIYTLMKYDDDEDLVNRVNAAEDEPVLRYPFARVLDAAERNRFQQFWDELLAQTTSESLVALRNLAQRYSDRSPGEPKQLRRRLDWRLKETG
jgi:hypothetical protein